MRNKLSLKRQKGQGMTEYIIIVAVIALLSLVLVTQFGDTIRMWFKAGGERMAGDNTTQIEVQTTDSVNKQMGDF